MYRLIKHTCCGEESLEMVSFRGGDGGGDVAGDVDTRCDCGAVQKNPAAGYGMARLGLFGGGGGMSSESGSGGCFRFCAWTP